MKTTIGVCTTPKPNVPAHNQYLADGLTLEMLPNLPLAARKPRRLVTRSGARVRGINLHGRFAQMHWESQLESSLYLLLAMTRTVAQVFSQPLVLDLKMGEYTPDALVIKEDGSRVWIECKPSAKLDEETRQKLGEAGALLRVFGDRMVVVDESELDEDLPQVNNARYLSPWFDPCLTNPPELTAPALYGDVVQSFGAALVNAALAAGLYRMDMSQLLNRKSMIVTALQGEGYEPSFLSA